MTVDRRQFTLTITYHYLFPILTMGLALFIAYFKTVSYLAREDRRFPLLRKTGQTLARGVELSGWPAFAMYLGIHLPYRERASR